MIESFRPRLEELQRSCEAQRRSGKTEEAAATQALIDRCIAALPMLAVGPLLAAVAAAPALHVRVRMLLTAKDWPLAWNWRMTDWADALVQ